MDKFAGDYRITDHISVAGEHFALGEHLKSPAPYGVWSTNEKMTDFFWGHYFTNKNDAIADMVQRATYRLMREDGIPLAVDFLAENAREALENQFRMERVTESIKEALEEVLCDDEEYPTELSAEEIMKNPEFMEKAIEAYNGIDHSEESWAIQDAITDILDEHPSFLTTQPQKTSLDQLIQSAQEKTETGLTGANQPRQER